MGNLQSLVPGIHNIKGPWFVAAGTIVLLK